MPAERDQLVKDAINDADWGDVAHAATVFPNPNMEPPDSLGDLTPAQRKYICNRAKKLPKRDAGAIEKICNECGQ